VCISPGTCYCFYLTKEKNIQPGEVICLRTYIARPGMENFEVTQVDSEPWMRVNFQLLATSFQALTELWGDDWVSLQGSRWVDPKSTWHYGSQCYKACVYPPISTHTGTHTRTRWQWVHVQSRHFLTESQTHLPRLICKLPKPPPPPSLAHSASRLP
jgi:hypothetical protein